MTKKQNKLNPENEFWGVDIYESLGKIYWVDALTGLHCINMDGSAEETIVSHQGFHGLAIDELKGEIYLSDWNKNQIVRINCDGTGYQEVLIPDIRKPIDIDIDQIAERIFWASYGDLKIQSAFLDGSELKNIATTELITPVSIALNNTEGPTVPKTFYDVCFDTTSPPTTRVSHRVESKFFDPDRMEELTTYYWQVTASNVAGSTTGPIWQFTTEDLLIPGMIIKPTAGLTVTNAIGTKQNRTITVSNVPPAGDGNLNFSVLTTINQNLISAPYPTSAKRASPEISETSEPTYREKILTRASSGISRPPKEHDFKKVDHGKKYKPGHLLVKFSADISKADRDALLALVDAKLLKKYNLVPGLCLIKLGTEASVEECLQFFNGTPGIDYAEPDYVWETSIIPNDPRFNEQWGLHNTGQTGGTPDADIDATKAWSACIGSHKITVAVIDTGVDYNHPDLDDIMWVNLDEIPDNGIDDDKNGFIDDVYGYDFFNNDGDPLDDHGHGTHCAGIIGAEANNTEGVSGVSWNSRIMTLKFLNQGGYGTTAGAVSAIEYAVLMGARVLSASWGGGGYNQALKDAIDAAAAMEIPFVAAAGNNSLNNDHYPFYPSSYDSPNVISVISSDHHDGLSYFSNFGKVSTDLAAPGSFILSCRKDGGYQYKYGTSMAAPHVSGACALLMSINPSLTATEIKEILIKTSDLTLPGICVSEGRMNLASSVAEIFEPWLKASPNSISELLPHQSTNITISFNSTDLEEGGYTGALSVISNDPQKSRVTIPIALIVEPDYLTITPETNFVSSGIIGGPFYPNHAIYNLSNAGPRMLEWSISESATWLNISRSHGILSPETSIDIRVAIDKSAKSLEIDSYQTSILFSNITQTTTQTCLSSINVTLPRPEIFIYYNLNTDPEWIVEGNWSWGMPQGGGSHNHDPEKGYKGSKVYGYNLSGDYLNHMLPEWLTTTALNCSDYSYVMLFFYRWIGVGNYDYAAIEASNDGYHWHTVWSNDGNIIEDSEWQSLLYDISEIADGEPTVYIRWIMGPTDQQQTYPGWNIDNIGLIGISSEIDRDEDSIPDMWEIQYFGHPENCNPHEDSDGDGQNNLNEFIAGMDPTQESSIFTVTASTPMRESGNIILEWESTPNRYYDINWTSNLLDGFQIIEADIEYPQNSFTDTVYNADSEGFYSISVRSK
ncbi:MAG TPA: S8 family serine peptidase [Pontiella sp.]